MIDCIFNDFNIQFLYHMSPFKRAETIRYKFIAIAKKNIESFTECVRN